MACTVPLHMTGDKMNSCTFSIDFASSSVLLHLEKLKPCKCLCQCIEEGQIGFWNCKLLWSNCLCCDLMKIRYAFYTIQIYLLAFHALYKLKSVQPFEFAWFMAVSTNNQCKSDRRVCSVRNFRATSISLWVLFPLVKFSVLVLFFGRVQHSISLHFFFSPPTITTHLFSRCYFARTIESFPVEKLLQNTRWKRQ